MKSVFCSGEKWKYSVDRPGKVIGDRCSCKLSVNDRTTLKCKLIDDDTREKIHRDFWALSWGEKKLYICQLVEKVSRK